MKRGINEVETLKLNGWKVGDIILDFNPKKLTLKQFHFKITCIGEERILGRFKNRSGYENESSITLLNHREWQKI